MLLAFAFGLRHGLEADHIVVIDSLTLRASAHREKSAPWIGAFFAVGHGVTVTLVSLLILFSASGSVLSNRLIAAVSWVPIVLLSLLGFGNLFALLRPTPYRPLTWKQRLLPPALRDSSNPYVIAAIGVLFALVIDSFVQGAVLASMALVGGGLVELLALGLVFTAGMAVSETLDSQLVFRAIGGHDQQRIAERQRSIGMLVVGLSFGTVAYALWEKYGLPPSWGDALSITLGVLAIAAMILLWLRLKRAERRRQDSVPR
ncbi:MAG: nickel permease [Nevskia sp.]|nr:nickel permease [Nevskia sp.]